MPTYEYQCKSCDHRFEVAQKMSDEPLTVCPECNGTLRRVLFPAGIVFKGSGFYKTDHGSGAVVSDSNHSPSESKENKEGAAQKESASGETKSSTGNEKPAASGDQAAATTK